MGNGKTEKDTENFSEEDVDEIVAKLTKNAKINKPADDEQLEFDRQFGIRIRWLRLVYQKEKRAHDLAIKLKIKRATYSAWEAGIAKPLKIRYWRALAAIYDVTPAFLNYGIECDLEDHIRIDIRKRLIDYNADVRKCVMPYATLPPMQEGKIYSRLRRVWVDPAK